MSIITKHSIEYLTFVASKINLVLSFDPYTINLPISAVISEIKENLIQENSLIISAPPGAGKSTIIPLALMDESWLDGKKILMLEPRRLAARTIASRMSSLINSELGKTVGFRIRFDNKTSESTKIEVLTEGILTRMMQSDTALDGIGMVIFDEFHERNIHADTALALCREIQQVLRPDLRIVIMSATIDVSKLKTLLNAPSVISKGKQYPVEIIYTGTQDENLIPELSARAILSAIDKYNGDTLAFLPGEGEINACYEILKNRLHDFAIYPLYGMLSQARQFAAIMPHKSGKRKIVLATSIAETSLTIEGIGIVVDSGFGRTSKFDPKSGLSRLETIRISMDSADQRAGRAGRLSPGTCIRLWSKATEQRMQKHRVPEILEADLAGLALNLALWGIQDASKLCWLTPPPKAALEAAQKTLTDLEAFNDDGHITDHGKKLHSLPCHPRIAHMLLMAETENLLPLACDVAAILEERDPLPKDSGIDINLRIEALRRTRQDRRLSKRMAKIEKVASSYRHLFNQKVKNNPVDPYETGLLLVYAYPERIACSRPGNNAQFQLSNGKIVMAGHKDELAWESWLAVAHMDAREGIGRIFMASPLNPTDLAPLVKQKEVIKWDTRKGGIIANSELLIGTIILQAKALPNPDPAKITHTVSEAISKEGGSLLDLNDEFSQLQNRIMCLTNWCPEFNWPDVSLSTLLEQNRKWLGPYIKNIRKTEDLKKLNLAKILYYFLDQEKQIALDKLAPQRIKVPSGSNIKLKYQHDGSAPVLAVRLQEVFGLMETPTVNNGRNPVLMHLLSPGFKPVQVTSDLCSFWDKAYFEVRKELKRRYPKHAWPENPFAEAAVKGVKKKKS